MTQEEKRLVLLDLSARLPHGVICSTPKGDGHLCSINQTIFGTEYGININPIKRDYFGDSEVEEQIVKPYLRSMSSMTEEEIEEYRSLSDEVIGSYGPYHHEFIAHCIRLGIKPDNPHECVDDFLNMEAIDWLNSHHFDYRGLIPMGLALEAKEGMYKTE